MIFVISGPSGSGKSTLVSGAINGDPLVRRSVSCTTRSPRPGEVNGVHYHFISREKFLHRVSQGEFVERDEIYGELYGTLYSELERTEDGKKDVVLVINYKGANSVKNKFPTSQRIFILPPSFSELGRRLMARGQETREEIALRLAVAVREIEEASFDYWIENDKIHSATGALISLFSILRHGNVPVYGFKDLPTLERVRATLPSRV